MYHLQILLHEFIHLVYSHHYFEIEPVQNLFNYLNLPLDLVLKFQIYWLRYQYQIIFWFLISFDSLYQNLDQKILIKLHLNYPSHLKIWIFHFFKYFLFKTFYSTIHLNFNEVLFTRFFYFFSNQVFLFFYFLIILLNLVNLIKQNQVDLQSNLGDQSYFNVN